MPRKKIAVPVGIPVRCEQNGIVFGSQAIACRILRLDKGSLCNHLQGSEKHRHVGGYTFSLNLEPAPLKPMHRGRKNRVRCDQTGIIYATQNHAARALGISKASLSKHLNGYPANPRVGEYTFTRITN